MNEINNAHLELIEATLYSYEKACGLKKQPKTELNLLERIILRQIGLAHKYNPLFVTGPVSLSTNTIKAYMDHYSDTAEEACHRYFLKHRFEGK